MSVSLKTQRTNDYKRRIGSIYSVSDPQHLPGIVYHLFYTMQNVTKGRSKVKRILPTSFFPYHSYRDCPRVRWVVFCPVLTVQFSPVSDLPALSILCWIERSSPRNWKLIVQFDARFPVDDTWDSVHPECD